MNQLIFTEEFCQPENLHPFTLTRQIQDIRVGILTIREKWERMMRAPSWDKKEDDYKDLERSVHIDEAVGSGVCYMIHGNILPTRNLVAAVKKLRGGEFLATPAGDGIVYRITGKEVLDRYRIKMGAAVVFAEPVLSIRFPWDIFRLNETALNLDFKLLTTGRVSQKIHRSNRVTKSQQIFIEKGARVENCSLNAAAGPIYIGKDAEIEEGCLLRGPLAVGEGTRLKMGTRIYGATTIGPGCVAGGEIKNSVIFGHSNKAHDGYLGDSVIGEWCNLGAGTSNSNLRNNAGEVKIWTPKGERPAGNKCGVMMGDYTRTAIHTAINTGTVIGVCCNVFGSGLTPRYIPSFSWGSEGVKRYELDKAFGDIDRWKQLKGLSITDNEMFILKNVFEKY